jgi:replicative DNA helicase
MAEKNTKKITPIKQQQIDIAKQVLDYKLGIEASIVAMIYKTPDLLRENKLDTSEFHHNTWKVYFEIAKDLIINEKKNTISDIDVGIYLGKHPKLEEKYEQYGGFQTIETAGSYVDEQNFDGYVRDLRKWNAVIKLVQRGFPCDKERLSEICDMSAEDLYDEYTVYLNDIFINIDQDVKSYDISYKIDELIDELDQGLAIGLPYYNMPMITKETGGLYLGSITLVGGLSNVGKSTFARTSILPSVIRNKEPIVIMLNEDSIKKWQRELLVFVANCIMKFDLQKHVVRDGKYSKEVKDVLVKSAEWIKEQTQNHLITIVPFQNYQTEKAIKVIRKFSSMGINQFLLDTYKLDAGKVNNNSWLELQQNMVAINDVIKPEANNVHIMITFQLAKGSVNQRYYTQDNIGVSKNIIDPASTCLMIRDVYDDEKTGEKRELKVYRIEGKNSKTKIQVPLDKDKRYQIIFIIKNREGSANQYQVVVEHDMSRNIMKEIGICQVPVDF